MPRSLKKGPFVDLSLSKKKLMKQMQTMIKNQLKLGQEGL